VHWFVVVHKLIVDQILTYVPQQTNARKNNKPGYKFLTLFKNLWKHVLSERKAQNLAMNRAQSWTSKNLDLFFEMCQKYYDHLEMHDKVIKIL
jgi:hypothetical protein